MKRLQDRKPWANGDDDRYCAKFIKRFYRMQLKKHVPFAECFKKLPPNLQTSIYWIG